jgi:hypothetical protein
MYYDIVVSDIVNSRIRAIRFFEIDGRAAAIKRYAKTARAKKELHHLLEEVLCWQPFYRLS